MAESEAEGGRRVRDEHLNPFFLLHLFCISRTRLGGGGGGDGATGGEMVSLAGPSRGMLLVSSRRDHVEKQYGVQLRPIQRCRAGPAALGSALGSRLLPPAVHGEGGREAQRQGLV